MSDEQKYSELLKEIGKILREKNDILIIQDYQIKDLKNRLQKAEQDNERNL